MSKDRREIVNERRLEERKRYREQQRKKQQRNMAMLLGIVVVVFAIGTLLFNPFSSKDKNQVSNNVESAVASANNLKDGERIEVKLLSGGDIVFHPITYSPEYEKVVEPYDFSHMFKRLALRLDQADYATITFETNCDTDREYNGFPLFNTPPEAISAIHEAGFDAFATATNHCLDAGGLQGMEKTLKKMDDVGVKHFGTKLNADDDILIEDIKGMKIAFLNYADAYNGLDAALTKEEKPLISPLEIDKVCDDIKKARESGADIVAVYPHWGVEYQTLPNGTQTDLAHQMAKAGADVIIGSHPHVMQPSEWVENDGHKTFIVYSLGNAMSNQREKFLGTIDTEIGAFAEVTFVKDKDGARVEKADLLPSTVYVHDADGKLRYETAIIEDLLRGEFKDELSATDKEHITALEKRAKEILAGEVSKKN